MMFLLGLLGLGLGVLNLARGGDPGYTALLCGLGTLCFLFARKGGK